MVPVSPWLEGEKTKPIDGDREIWWEEQDGKRLVSITARDYVSLPELPDAYTRVQIQPGAIEVNSVAGTVANGEVVCPSSPVHLGLPSPSRLTHSHLPQWIIQGVRNYA